MSNRTRRRAARRQKMLDEAMKIVEQEGLEGLTINRLPEALNAAVGALYRYFSGKEALLFAMQQEAIASYHEAQKQMLQDIQTRLKAEEQDDPQFAARIQLQALITAYIEDANYSPARHRLMFEFLSRYQPILSEEEALKAEAAVRQTLQFVYDVLRILLGGRRSNEELEQATHLVWASTHGLLQFRKREHLVPPHLKVETLLRASLRGMFLGWGATREEVNASMEWFERYRPSIRRILQQK